MDLDALYSQIDVEASATPRPGVVQRKDGTSLPSPYIRSEDATYEERADALFAGKPSYVTLKNEQPWHRITLWMSLQGMTTKEISAALGKHEVSVRTVKKQQWFRDAFVRLATEFGKNAVESFLKSEALPALQRTVELATSAESEGVQLAANKEILDRAFGKAVARVESTSITTTLDGNVTDVAALLHERALNEQRLRASGIVTGGSN